MQKRISLSYEITRCRKLLGVGQMVLSRWLDLKTHRLSDLEKGRSLPSPSEDLRLRRKLQRIVESFALEGDGRLEAC